MFQKLANFWFSSFVTERLLASPLFNRMAAKTHQHVSTITNKGQYIINDHFALVILI
jgi:hypothetical protein